jgi:hypothetical protein
MTKFTFIAFITISIISLSQSLPAMVIFNDDYGPDRTSRPWNVYVTN